MEVPASTTAAHGAENVSAGASSSLFGSLAEAARGKKGQLPPFAAILAEQSAGNDGSKSAALDASVSTEEQGAGELPDILATHVHADALLSLLPQKVSEDYEQSSPVTAAKSDVKATTRHLKSGSSLSGNPGKQQIPRAATSSTASALTMSMPQIPAPVMPPVVPESQHREVSSAAVSYSSPASQPHSPEMPIAQEAPHASPSLPAPNIVETAAPEAAAPRMTAPAKYDAGSEKIGPHQEQPSSPPVATDAIAASVSALRNGFQERPNVPQPDHSLTQGLPNGVNQEALSPAGSVMQQAAVAMTKPKAQDKTTGVAARNSSTAPSVAGSSSVTTPATNSPIIAAASGHGDSSIVPGAKPATALPETNPFQRLDTGEAQPTLLHSSPHQISVGVRDPALGWLEVQTQSSAGHISATLTAASTEAHVSLAAQAPAIAQYLADRNLPVHSVQVHAQADAQSGAPGGGQSQSGAGNARHETSGREGAVTGESRRPSVNEVGSDAVQQAASGSYISVRA